MRDRVADLLDWLASELWRIANGLRRPYTGPLCPDCRAAPDPGEDGECEVCAERAEQARFLNEVEQEGFDRGYDAAIYDTGAKLDA